jgi:hypothetical protein
MSRTKQPDYDVKPDFGTVLDKHRQLPFKRFMDAISAKLADINDMINEPAPADQYPGKIIPYALPLLYGPLPLVSATNPPKTPVLARNGNALIGRELTFEVQSLAAYGFINIGYGEDPGYPVQRIGPLGDIFDSVTAQNGGAMPMDFFGGTFSTLSLDVPNQMNISFDVELYDRLRGRRLHEGRLPVEMFQSGRIAHRKIASPIQFEKGSNIEPRLWLNEIQPGFDPATAPGLEVKAYVCLILKGRQFVEVPGV